MASSVSDDFDADMQAEHELFGEGGRGDGSDNGSGAGFDNDADEAAEAEDQIRMRRAESPGVNSEMSVDDSASSAPEAEGGGSGCQMFWGNGNYQQPQQQRQQRQQPPVAASSQAGGGAAANGANGAAVQGPGIQNNAMTNSVASWHDYHEVGGSVVLGHNLTWGAPIFRQGFSSSSGWMPYFMAGVTGDSSTIRPVRTMVLNIPAECFSLDATKFTDWQTPMNNSVRAASIAALLGLMTTPLSKGFLSGQHEEVARQVALEGNDSEGQRGSAERKKLARVTWHMMQAADGSPDNSPMVVVGYEDIYDRKRENVVAIRYWHFVFDPTHSTSELARKLMDENADESDHSGAAHQQNCLRKPTVVAAAKASRGLVGASLASAQLELAAGMVYRHVTNESSYKNLLAHYAGRTDHSKGRPPVDLQRLPVGVLNHRMSAAEHLGCVHPLGFEWVFNAKRPAALAAGLVHLDGTEMDVDPSQIDVHSYFEMSSPPLETDSHAFRVPNWVGSDQNGGKGCFYFQTDPFQQNAFDMVLPHSISGAIKPGRALMSLYKERFCKPPPPGEPVPPDLPIDSPALLNQFNNKMTGCDQWVQQQINSMQDSIVAFDTFECSANERMEASQLKRVASRGIESYGQTDGDSHVVEPRQVLKSHAYTTSNVYNKLISPWSAETRMGLVAQEEKLRTLQGGAYGETSIADAHFKSVREAREAFEKRHHACMKELILLHLAKMERSFTSKIDNESIPAGYRAVWDGLQLELQDMPNKTANVAFAYDVQMTDSDRTVFGHMQNWLGTFFEDDCFGTPRCSPCPLPCLIPYHHVCTPHSRWP